MLYPLKFYSIYKDYLWGGTNLRRLGKKLPSGITAESWEVSCHPAGTSFISNGDLKDKSLIEVIKNYKTDILGYCLKDIKRFPLLVKFIDANKKLSVQVHPNDEYALSHEKNEYGKNELWYIIWAKEGAEIIYDLLPGVTKDILEKSIKDKTIERYLKHVKVSRGDIVYIPSGVVHGIGEGILLAEIQQSSNLTYRLYDYDRIDKSGGKRQLHIKQAFQVIDFDSNMRKEKYKGIKLELNSSSFTRYLSLNPYFCTELLEIRSFLYEKLKGDRFYILSFIEGEGNIVYKGGKIYVKGGESVLIPACMGNYKIEGTVKVIKSYVSDNIIIKSIIDNLLNKGYLYSDVINKISGMDYFIDYSKQKR